MNGGRSANGAELQLKYLVCVLLSVQAGDPQEVCTAEKHQIQSSCIWEEGVDKRKGEKTHIQTQKCKSEMDLISKFSYCAVLWIYVFDPCVWYLCFCSQLKHQNRLQQSSRQSQYFIRYGVYSYQAKITSFFLLNIRIDHIVIHTHFQICFQHFFI